MLLVRVAKALARASLGHSTPDASDLNDYRHSLNLSIYELFDALNLRSKRVGIRGASLGVYGADKVAVVAS
jgi:hypothetical protein